MFPAERFPQLLVGLGATRDDAAVYKITDDTALIVTLDFFTPVVDDPYQYGAIAATNALSDIYAMGGRVALALNISCLSECLPPEIVGEILRGGAEKVAEAGGVIVGGHSVDDKEPKYGLVAVGFVHPDRVLTKAGAQPGDVLVLTKPLGVGIITTAFKADQTKPEHFDAAVQSMLKLNQAAADLLQRGETHVCTDISGFALLGHACEVAEKSGVKLRLHVEQIPFLPGARDYADLWLFPAGTGHNKDYFARHVRCEPSITEEVMQLLYTPETSGGLLAAIPPDRLDALESDFATANEPLWVVGEVLDGTGIEVVP
jgi:selenide,water dikinase